MPIQLTITAHLEDQVKLAWQIEFTQFMPYTVARRPLEKYVTALRSKLELLGTSEALAPDSTALNAILLAVAREGYKIYQALFFSPGTPTDQIQAAVNDASDDQLLVFSDASIHIPWGFLQRSEPIDTGRAADALAGLLVSHLRITTRFNLSDFLRPKPIPRERFRAIYAIGDAELTTVMAQLSESEKFDLLRLMHYEVGRQPTWQACRAKWREIEDFDSLIYIFGHSNGERLMLDRDDPESNLDKMEFRMTFGRTRKSGDGASRRPASALSIFNGCSTLAGDGGAGFLDVTSTDGFLGFIGVEAKITNINATRCAIFLLKLLCESGLNIQDALARLHRSQELFPTCLLYSCYAHPEFRVLPVEAGALEVSA